MSIRNGPPDGHILDVHGDFACFSRPEMKVERFSYPCPTPGAARAIFEQIFFKPRFRWQVTQIELLAPPNYIALRRNEVKEKVSERSVKQWIAGKAEPEPILADADKGLLGTDQRGRTQRQTMALRNPRFRLFADIVPRPGREAEKKSFDEQFVRRASQGKCFQQPCLGCREFVAFFRYRRRDETLEPACDYSQNVGWMLYDMFDLDHDNYQYVENGTHAAIMPGMSLFQAEIEDGVLKVPRFESDAVRKPQWQYADRPKAKSPRKRKEDA